MRTSRVVASSLLAAAAAVLLISHPSDSTARTSGIAHDIPGDATVQMFVKPEGQRLRLLVRVPLNTMQDILFPTFGPGYLDIAEADDEIREGAMLWVGTPLRLFEGEALLQPPEIAAAIVSIPSDPSFRTYDDALAHVTGPRLPDQTQLIWQQAVLDVLFEYPIESDASEFSMDPGLERLALRRDHRAPVPAAKRLGARVPIRRASGARAIGSSVASGCASGSWRSDSPTSSTESITSSFFSVW